MLLLLVALALFASSGSAQVDSRCRVRSMRTNAFVACKEINEYEVVDYEGSMQTLTTCVRFTVDGGALNPKFKAGDSVDNYKGKFWCPTKANYVPTEGTGLDWGVCGTGLPAVCFPPPTLAPTPKPTKPTTRAPTKKPTTGYPTTRAPTRKPSTKAPTKKPTSLAPTRPTTLTPTVLPTISPTTAKPTKPTKKPTRSPTKKPTKPQTAKPTKKPTRSPTKKPTKKTG
ncbi:hypothetical protein BASA81_012920 [Batrachochytrium salamandrivorans]|nr:hypothetical protein BASA81_012920 [Batrachochytrium salamandrivorans]